MMIPPLLLKIRATAILLVLMTCTTGCARSIVANSHIQQSASITKVGKRYVVHGEVDLKGQTLNLPSRAVLDCRNGILSNGRVVGKQNKVLYSAPFVGGYLTIEGCYVEDIIVRSENILTKNGFSNQDVHNVFNLARNGATVVYEGGTYKDITHINISKNVTIDFSNSIIETAIDKDGLSCSVFLTDAEPSTLLKSVVLKNVIIDGKIPKYGLDSSSGQRRNAIRIVGANNVVLDNVTIRNFRYGTNGYYAKNVKKRHMAGVCVIMDYTNCTIQNCELSMCTGEGFYIVPEENDHNYLLFRGNKSKQNYGTFLTLVDGKCLVEDNEMEKFGLSGMNVFCYNSVIRNNHFKGGERYNCIDITENGLYWPRNVEISNNTADECEGFIMASGENITITNNVCKNPTSAFALTIYGYSKTNESSPEYLIQRGKAGGDVKVKIQNNDWQCRGGIATYPGCNGELSIIGNTITIIPNDIKSPHRGTAMEFYGCKKLLVEGNTFNNSYRNSITRANVYITIKSSSCEAIIKNNNFNKTIPNTDISHFLFTEDATFEDLIIEDNQSNVQGINARVVEGRLAVKGKKKVRNNRGIVVRGTALE